MCDHVPGNSFSRDPDKGTHHSRTEVKTIAAAVCVCLCVCVEDTVQLESLL